MILQGPKGAKRDITDEFFEPFSPADWREQRTPSYDWIVDGCFLRGTVAILAGDGGLGKSLLMQQLMTAAAVGDTWLGMSTQRVRSLAVYCEDDLDELHRRQERINNFYECGMGDLEPMRIESRAGRDCVLMRFRQWGDDGKTTVMYDKLEYAAIAHQAKIVVLDTVADVFAGNEIDRNQPRVFIRALRRLAIKIQGVVILTQHPSNEGMASGSGRSGSTGWHNSVRSRLYLTTTKKPGKDDEGPGNERFLKTMKNNQGPFGGKIKLKWSNGVFVRVEDQMDLYYQERDTAF